MEQTKNINMSFECKDLELTKSEDGVEYGVFSGYASTKDVDLDNDVILPTAFAESIEKYASRNRKVLMLFNHDSKEMIGTFDTRDMRIDDRGLFVKGELDLSIQRAREVYSFMKKRALSDMSIGTMFNYDDVTTKDNIRTFNKVSLREISVVVTPANPAAEIMAVKSEKLDFNNFSLKDAESFLASSGLSNKEAKTFISKVKSCQRDVDNSVLRDAIIVKANELLMQSKLDDFLSSVN